MSNEHVNPIFKKMLDDFEEVFGKNAGDLPKECRACPAQFYRYCVCEAVFPDCAYGRSDKGRIKNE